MYILSSAEMSAAEEAADKKGVSFYTLMKNAGNAAADYIVANCETKEKRVAVLCGSGNNGGDGFVIAGRLFEQGLEVSVVLLCGEPKTDCAKRAFSDFCGNVPILSPQEFLKRDMPDIVVDAIFGTGFKGEPSDGVKAVMNRVRESGAAVFAVDLPSGVICDSGACSEAVIPADYTLAFAALKYCHILPPANGLCGKVEVLDIGIEKEILEREKGNTHIISPPVFKRREKNSHKGNFGTVLALAGSYGMPGAAIIACRAALKAGPGIVKIASVKENYTALALSCPEAVQLPLETEGKTLSKGEIKGLCAQLKGASSLLIGCGMGISPEAEQAVLTLLTKTEIPTLLDADGINNIASSISILKKVKAPLVLTPHPGEMARLTGKTVCEIEADRLGTAKNFAKEYGVWLCLKGANTIVAAPDGRVFVNLLGNPGMASGGSGDMLAGLMAGFLAYMPIEKAVLSAVWLHSRAGDMARDRRGETSMTVLDMLDML